MSNTCKLDASGLFFNETLVIDATKTYLTDGGDGTIDTSNMVKITGDQTIDGVKTFNDTIIGNIRGDVIGDISGNIVGDVSGNAGTVTNGVYTVGDQTIEGIKVFVSDISANITGNANTVTGGVYLSSDQVIDGVKTFSETIVGSISGNAGTVTHGVYTNTDNVISGTTTFTQPIIGTVDGTVTTNGDQTIGGAKTFTDTITFEKTIIGNIEGEITATNLNIDGASVSATEFIMKDSLERTRLGYQALELFQFNSANSAFGHQALSTVINSTESNNTAIGHSSLQRMLYGVNNTAVGTSSMQNIEGSSTTTRNQQNTAVGYQSMMCNTGDGAINVNFNTAIGSYSLYRLGSESQYNSAFGYEAGKLGDKSLYGSNNTFLGAQTRFDLNTASYSNSTAIGYGATIDSSNQIMIGTANESAIVKGNLTVVGSLFANVEAQGTVSDNITVNDTANINTLSVGGNASFQGSQFIVGQLTPVELQNTLTVDLSATITGDLFANSNLTVDGQTHLNDTLIVDADVSLNNGLDVCGNALFHNPVTISVETDNTIALDVSCGTRSEGANSGAVVVKGGVGIGQTLHIGGTGIYIDNVFDGLDFSGSSSIDVAFLTESYRDGIYTISDIAFDPVLDMTGVNLSKTIDSDNDSHYYSVDFEFPFDFQASHFYYYEHNPQDTVRYPAEIIINGLNESNEATQILVEDISGANADVSFAIVSSGFYNKYQIRFKENISDKTLIALGGIKMSGYIRQSHSLTVHGDSKFHDDIDVCGNLIVSGTSTFEDQLTIRSGGMDISGASTIDGGLTVSSGGIDISGASSINGGLTVSSGGMNITGASTINSGLTVVSGLELNETTGTYGTKTGGTLTLSHDDSGGANSIVFKNAINADNYGAISYVDNIFGATDTYADLSYSVLQQESNPTNNNRNCSVLVIQTQNNTTQSSYQGGDSIVICPAANLILDTGVSKTRNDDSLIIMNPDGATAGCVVIGKQIKTIETSKLEVSGNSIFEGDVVITGASTLSDQLTVSSGGMAITGASTLSDQLTVSNNGINITGASSINGTLTVSSGGMAITGASSIAGTLTVSSGGMAITGASSIAGTLTVSSGGLTVSSDGMAITGASSIAGQLTVSSGGMAITGASTIDGALTVSNGNVGIGTTSPAAILDVSGDIILTGSTGYGLLHAENGSVMFIGESAVGAFDTQKNAGGRNTAVGDMALTSAYANDVSRCVAIGYRALLSCVGGSDNIAIGHKAGEWITGGSVDWSGNNNIFIGSEAGPQTNSCTNSITIGDGVKAYGDNEFRLGSSAHTVYIPGTISAVTANSYSATSTAAGYKYTFDSDNDTGIWWESDGKMILKSNGYNIMNISTGGNIYFGYNALGNYQSGDYNTAVGTYALYSQTTGSDNVAFGHRALDTITTGSYNTAIGYYAGRDTDTGQLNENSSYNTCIGMYTGPSTSGEYNYSTAIGYGAKFNASNQIVLGTASETVNIPGTKLDLSGTIHTSTGEIRFSNSGYYLGILYTCDDPSDHTYTGNTVFGSTNSIGYTNNLRTIGNQNTIIGSRAMNNPKVNGARSQTTAIGYASMTHCNSGHGNTALGRNSGYIGGSTEYKWDGQNNTFIGHAAGLSTDLSGLTVNNSTAIGYYSQITASNQIVLGTPSETVYVPGSINHGVKIGPDNTSIPWGVSPTEPALYVNCRHSVTNNNTNIVEVLKLERSLNDLPQTSEFSAGGYIGMHVTDNNGTSEGARISWRNRDIGVEHGETKLQFWTSDSTDGLTERMIIDHDGNVGIGTTTPSASLHVLLADYSNNNLAEILRLERVCGAIEKNINAEGGYIGLYVTDNDATNEFARISWRADNADNNEVDGRLGFWTDSQNDGLTERMTITPDGNVGIGTTSPNSTYLLDVNGALRYLTTINSGSDNRLKHNETDISNALQHIRDLHPQHYIKTITMYDADHHFDLDVSGQPIDSSGNPVDHVIEEGLIAQDLLKLPAFQPFVSVPKDPTTKPYSVNYNSIFIHAISALQELDTLHTETRAELNEARLKIASLEEKMAQMSTN